MKNLISIKEARIKKGLSINDLSKGLKLDPEIIRLLEENLQLPDKFKEVLDANLKPVLIDNDFLLSLNPVSKPISETGLIPKFSLKPNL